MKKLLLLSVFFVQIVSFANENLSPEEWCHKYFAKLSSYENGSVMHKGVILLIKNDLWRTGMVLDIIQKEAEFDEQNNEAILQEEKKCCDGLRIGLNLMQNAFMQMYSETQEVISALYRLLPQFPEDGTVDQFVEIAKQQRILLKHCLVCAEQV
ncbi:MAG TPA: hypothetical protein ENI08_01965 [Candidatus Dependentiae bacterium]|nr:hypothetical protein [Candidatus Dependentiae bacterium]